MIQFDSSDLVTRDLYTQLKNLIKRKNLNVVEISNKTQALIQIIDENDCTENIRIINIEFIGNIVRGSVSVNANYEDLVYINLDSYTLTNVVYSIPIYDPTAGVTSTRIEPAFHHLGQVQKESRKMKAVELPRYYAEKPAPSPAKTNIADYFSVWLEDHRADIRANTFEDYESALNNHIIPYFTAHPVTLEEVKPMDLKGYFNEKRKELSVCTLKKHRSYMTAMFKYARFNELLFYDPMENVKLPPQSKFRSEVYDDEEISSLLSLAKKQKEPIYPAIYLSAKLGLRRSEVAGVRWSNINWKKKTLRIDRTIVYCGGLPVEVENTKTTSSCREIPLSPKVVDFLKELQNSQELNRHRLKSKYKSEYGDYICVKADGSPLSPNTITTRFKKFLEKNDLKKIRFHDLRHSVATSLINGGTNVKAVSELLGHSDISTTLGIYTHVNTDDISEAMLGRDNSIGI